VQAGLVFLGTPHPTHNQPDSSLSMILRSFFKISGKTLAEAELNSATISNLSMRFADVVGSVIPIISAYESKETRIISDKLFRAKKMVVSTSTSLMILKCE
jgi:hypothetical protein